MFISNDGTKGGVVWGETNADFASVLKYTKRVIVNTVQLYAWINFRAYALNRRKYIFVIVDQI